MQEVETVRMKWSENILTSFRTVTSKLTKDDQEEDEDESVNYVYDCLSFLDYMGKVKPENGLRVRQLSIYMFPANIMPLPTFKELKSTFSFLDSPDNIGSRDNESLYR